MKEKIIMKKVKDKPLSNFNLDSYKSPNEYFVGKESRERKTQFETVLTVKKGKNIFGLKANNLESVVIILSASVVLVAMFSYQSSWIILIALISWNSVAIIVLMLYFKSLNKVK